ncbi:MAG: alkaline phosphatase family protein, partial [Planctomycetes bacterium]|nr:alkaline phosphatase family protein [Planctomycetota bacterium]
SIDFAKSVYPESLQERLMGLNYRLDVDAQLAHKSMMMFLGDLDETLDARIEAYRCLWDSRDWQTFMLVFTGTDRLMHFLWEAYEDKGHRYHKRFLDHFRKIDAAIGEIAAKLGDDDLLIMHSDHGFERLDREVYVSYLLEENGFLQFKQDTDPATENICFGTRAFVLDPGRIYLNFKGKYPCGSVEASDAEGVLFELETLFSGLECDGRKVIRDIYRKEDIYSGPYLEQAPDMVLVAAEGFNLKATTKGRQLYDNGIFTGKHTQDTAFLLVRGLKDAAVVPDEPWVMDIKGIVEKARSG